MTTITRQQLTDCVNPHELVAPNRSKEFNEHYLWLWGAIITNDVINVTPALKDQLQVMFTGWPNTIAAIKTLIGA